LLLECSVSQASVSLVVRGVGQRSSERHRRAADKRLLSAIWLVAERNQASTADSEREWHTQPVSAFRCGAAGAVKGRGSPLDDMLSQRELPHSTHTGTLQLQALLHMNAMCSSSLLDEMKMSLQVKFETFCDQAASGRLADVQRMLESGELLVDGNLNEAIWRAAANGHIDVVDYLLQHAMFDPTADRNRAIQLAAAHGHLAVVERLLQDERVDRSADKNAAIAWAAANGHLAVVERLLQDERVDPSDTNNFAVKLAAENGHLAVVDRLLQDKRVDPSADDNDAVQSAARNGHLAIVERLLQDKRVDPSAHDNWAVKLAAERGRLAVVDRLLQDKRVDPSAGDNYAVRWAAHDGRIEVVDRLLEDDRVDAAVAIHHTHPEDRGRFGCRERLTEICIGLQSMELPAWVTVQILDAARPWSTLPLHSKWNLVCAIKHFRDKKQ
jgi:ankyrin repeat protein